MTPFNYAARSADPTDFIREDLAVAHREAWQHIAAPGSWLSGEKRIAVAEETRRARSCALCADRKTALSPFSSSGEHDHSDVLSPQLVDQIHRVTTDAGRLTRAWYTSLLSEGLSAEEYVEALGVTVVAISIDEFHHALGMPYEPLPAPLEGKPSHYRPSGAEIEEGQAWVPILAPGRTTPPEKDIFAGIPPGAAPNVIRALSLVPAEVRAWKMVSSAQYLSTAEMRSFETKRAIDRSQIELVAGRVSAINECFY
jgi:hypothetical protein